MPQIDVVGRRPWLDARLDALLAGGALIRVAESEGIVAGFATVDPTLSHVDQIAVAPAFQNRGIAAALLADARRLCPGGIELVVNRDNAPARRLYARHGFEIVAEDVNPTSGLPVLILRWRPAAEGDAASATPPSLSPAP